MRCSSGNSCCLWKQKARLGSSRERTLHCDLHGATMVNPLLLQMGAGSLLVRAADTVRRISNIVDNVLIQDRLFGRPGQCRHGLRLESLIIWIRTPCPEDRYCLSCRTVLPLPNIRTACPDDRYCLSCRPVLPLLKIRTACPEDRYCPSCRSALPLLRSILPVYKSRSRWYAAASPIACVSTEIHGGCIMLPSPQPLNPYVASYIRQSCKGLRVYGCNIIGTVSRCALTQLHDMFEPWPTLASMPSPTPVSHRVYQSSGIHVPPSRTSNTRFLPIRVSANTAISAEQLCYIYSYYNDGVHTHSQPPCVTELFVCLDASGYSIMLTCQVFDNLSCWYLIT